MIRSTFKKVLGIVHKWRHSDFGISSCLSDSNIKISRLKVKELSLLKKNVIYGRFRKLFAENLILNS